MQFIALGLLLQIMTFSGLSIYLIAFISVKVFLIFNSLFIRVFSSRNLVSLISMHTAFLVSTIIDEVLSFRLLFMRSLF